MIKIMMKKKNLSYYRMKILNRKNQKRIQKNKITQKNKWKLNSK